MQQPLKACQRTFFPERIVGATKVPPLRVLFETLKAAMAAFLSISQKEGGPKAALLERVKKVRISNRRGRRPRRPGSKIVRFLSTSGEFVIFQNGPSRAPAPTKRFFDSLKEGGPKAALLLRGKWNYL